MTQIKSKKNTTSASSSLVSLRLVRELTRRTANLKCLDKIFSETISCLKSLLETNDVHIYTYAIKNQKLDFEYQKIGNTGQLKKTSISQLPINAELARSAAAQKTTVIIQVNPENSPFIPSSVNPLIKTAIPFLYRSKVLGCIHITSPKPNIQNDELQLCGELISQHLELICTNAIEQHHMAEFKSRVRRLINVKVNQLEEALKDAAKYNQSLKDFSYIVSHDLREPLRTINSYIKLLERRYNDHFDSDAKDFMFFVTDGVARMDALIQDLLAFSRVEHSIYHFEEIALDKILTLVQNSLRLKIAETNAQIKFCNPPTIIASRSHLNILIQNLVDNAIKFKKDSSDPIINIETKELNDHWQFSVSDNGMGMNLEHKNNERIFKIFQRLHGMDSNIPGTGIGLAICKNIVNAHGGKIWVSSTQNEGSTFHFTIAKKLNNH